MKRFGLGVAAALLLALVYFLSLSFSAQAAPSLTPVCGLISTNTTWTAANSPYEVCSTGATVNAGITLTVQSGVTVQFVPGSSPLLAVHGKLLALGLPAQPITFTAVLTAQSPGAWQGLTADGTLLGPAVVDLNHVTLDYGGTNAVFYGAQLYAGYATLTVTHSLLRNGQKNGIWTTGVGSIAIEDTVFTNNAADAVHLTQPALGLALSGLTASGNGLNAVYVGGTTYLAGQHLWPAAGIPYVVDGLLGNHLGDALTVEAGSELQFTSNGVLNIGGTLKAIGLPGAPITLTGQTKTPGAWAGLVLFGGLQPANAQLEHVTLEYGGRNASGANVTVDAGYLMAHYSIIRNSQRDGVRLNSNAHAALLNSQIISNTLYGVRNTQVTHAILATNDWWGDPNGPTDDAAACSPGHGDKITAGVLFRPVLTSTNLSAVFPLSNDPILTLTPRKWFGPADGLTRIYFDITLVDGNGAPLAGRTVRLNTSLGVATDGGITDANGHTLAYLVSNATGDADVTAALDVTSCEGAMSPTSQVSFTTPLNILDLFPNSPASYFDGNITISPQPVIVGVPALVSARLTNPLTVPITVDVSFGVAQSGINLIFGPIRDYVGQVIPPKGTITLSTDWVPPTTGHICIRVIYTVTGLGSGLALPSGPSSGSAGLNTQSHHGATGSSTKPGALDRTINALDAMGSFIGNAFDTDPFSIPLELLNRGITLQLHFSEIIFGALAGDPPRQDYKQLDSPHKLQLPPVQAGGGLTQARAAALNALDDALAEANADARASAIALDRSGGASAAGDLQWSSLQSAAVIHYNQLLGSALITMAARLDNVLNVAAGEGETSLSHFHLAGHQRPAAPAVRVHRARDF